MKTGKLFVKVKKNYLNFGKCNEPSCSVVNVEYESPVEDIKSLNKDYNCSQMITINCFAIHLSDSFALFSENEKFVVSSSASAQCECSKTKSCELNNIGKNLKCACDSLNNINDTIVITEPMAIPITKMESGKLGKVV